MTRLRFAFAPVLLVAISTMLIVASPREAEAQAIAFSGAIPVPGAAGLLVTSVPLASTDLVSELEFSGCTPEMVGLLTQGTWQIYIPGAPAAVNASFPASLAAATPFFTRCSVDSPPALARPTDAESEFVQMLLDTVFTQLTLDGLRPYMHSDLIATPGLDVMLEYSSELTGPLVGEYYLHDYAPEDVQLSSGEFVPASVFVVVGDFEKGTSAVTIVISASGATYRVVGWSSMLVVPSEEDFGLGQVELAKMTVGQCFNDSGAILDCSLPHDSEVFAVHQLGSTDTFPGDEAMLIGGDLCVDSFEDYVGTPYGASQYEVGMVLPDEETWPAGLHSAVCYLFDRDFAKLTGSVRGTAR